MLDCYLKKVTFQSSSSSYMSFYGDRRLTFIPLIRNLDDKWSRKDGRHYFLFNLKGEGKKKGIVIIILTTEFNMHGCLTSLHIY